MPGMAARFDADFSRFVGELDRVQVKLRSFTPDVDRSQARLSRLADSLQGHKLAEQAAIGAAAIEKIGGASRLSGRDLERFGRLFDQVAEQSQRFGRALPENISRIRGEIEGLRRSAEQLPAATGRVGGILGSITSGIGLGVGSSIYGTIASAVTTIANDGARMTPIAQSFEAIAGGAENADRQLREMQEATRGLVRDVDLMQASNKGALLGLNDMGISMSEVARVGTILGRAMGQDAAKSTDDLTTALARQSPMILDNLGIKMNLEEATRTYARSIGKSAEALTDEERKLAFATSAMEAARAKAAQLGEVQLTVWDQTMRASGALADIATSAFSAGNQSDGLAGALGRVADVLERIKRGAPSGMAAITRDVDLSLKTALQTAAQGTLSNAGPFGAAIQEYLRLRMGAMDPVDLSRMNAGARTGDIRLPGPPRPTTGGAGSTKPEDPAAIARRTAELRKYREELERLSGAASIASAERLARQIGEIGATRIPTDQIEGLAKQLSEARRTAQQTGRAIGEDVTKQLNALVQSPGYRALFQAGLRNPRVGGISSFEWGSMSSLAGLSTGTDALSGQLIPSRNPINTAYLAPVVRGLQEAKRETRDWLGGIQDVAQAFSQLSQITGGLDRVSEAIGRYAGSLSAASQLTRSIGLTGRAGANASAGISGAMLGFDLGANFGRVGGTLAGAAGGAAAGIPFAAQTGGASIAIGAVAGGISGYFGARNAESQLRKLKDLQAEQLIAQNGSLDALLTTVGRLGLNQQTFLERFYGEPREFAKGVSELNAALTREKSAADALAKAYDNVTRARGVLNRGQLQEIAGVRPGSPGEEATRRFLESQNDQAISGLERFLQTGPLTAAAASGAGLALGQSFEALLAYGVPADEAVRRLSASIEGYRKNAVEAGAGSTEAFDLLEQKLRALTDDALGPFVNRGLAAGQILAGMANQGRITQDIFSGLAPSVTEAYDRMEAMGQGGVEAVRMLQGPLQNIWQLQRDFGLEVDENTQRVLDFAQGAGVIGEQFRPAEDRMAKGIERLVELFEGFATTMDRLPVVAGKAADGMSAAFARVRVPNFDDINYTDGALERGAGAAAGRATGGVGDVYLDRDRVGFTMARGQSAVADYVSA